MNRSRVGRAVIPVALAGAFASSMFSAFSCGNSASNAPGFDASSDAKNDGPNDDANGDAGTSYPVVVSLTGCAPLYQAQVTIGGSSFAMSVDTGSSTTALAETGCSSCKGSGVSALYSPGANATSLGTPSSATYGDGQTWSGTVYEDDIGISGMPTIPADFVAIDAEKNFFFAPTCPTVSAVPPGILGLGPAAGALPNTTSVLDLWVTAGMPDVFAFELCSNSGSLWLGGFDPNYITAPPQYTPIVKAINENASYSIVLAGLALDGTPLAIADSSYGTAIVDTGGPHFILPTNAFQTLANMLGASTAFQSFFPDGAAYFSQTSCSVLTQSADALDAALPRVTLTLGAANPITLSLGATESYLIRVTDASGTTTFCPGILDSKSTAGWDIGDVVLQNFVTIFDRANTRLGFAPRVACP